MHLQIRGGGWAAAVIAAALLVAGPIVAARPVAAQERPDTARADTARYVLEPLTAAAERERSAPPPIATITVPAAVVHRTQSANPYDLLRRVAAVEVHEQGQGPGFASDAVIRGFTSDHSADVLLVVDGVPVNLPIHGHGEGYADWNVLLPGAVGSLRVIHGAASPLYGNFALGGVVEVFTAADADGPAGAVYGTSDADLGGWARTGRRGDDGGWLAASELRRDRGWRDNSTYWLGNGLARGWRRLGEGRLEGGLALYGAEWSSPGFVSVARYNRRELTAAMDPTDGGDARRAVLHGRYAAPLGGDAALQATAWGLLSDWRLFLNIPGHGDSLSQTGERDERVAAGAQLEASWIRPFGELTAGVEARADRAVYDLRGTEARRTVEEQVGLDARYASASTYLRWRRTFGDRLGLDVGGRFDAFRYASLDRLTDGAAWRDAVSAIASPKLGVRYLLADGISLLATSSRGFRGAVGVLGDPDRPPILAWAHEAGVRYERGPLEVHLSLFRLDVSNERTPDPVTREISSAGSSVRQGVDLDATIRLTSAVTLAIAGTFNDARLSSPYADAHDDHGHEHTVAAAVYEAAGAERFAAAAVQPAAGSEQPRFHLAHHPEDEQGEWVPGVSRYHARASLEGLLLDRFLARGSLRVVGPFIPIGEPEIRTRPYSVLDLGAYIPFGDGAWLDLELQNALGMRYPELRASGFVNPGRPRTLRASIRVDRFEF